MNRLPQLSETAALSGPQPGCPTGINARTNETNAVHTRYLCGERAVLPLPFVAAAIALAAPRLVSVDEVHIDLLCTLEEHTVGAHWGLVTDLDGPGTGAVWTPWTDCEPTGIVVLPDCPAIRPEVRESCAEFAAHPGAHSWEIQDRPEDESKPRTDRIAVPRSRTRPSQLHQEPESVTWAREKAGLTKRALAGVVGVSEQLMGEIESGWRSATPANLVKIAAALNCPVVSLERKRQWKSTTP